MTIKDFKSMPEGTEVKGMPLMIKTARKTFRDAEGTTFQEVVFMDASGEITGHILMKESGEELAYRSHKTSGLPVMKLWKSKTNICIMDGVLQQTDERMKEGIKLVVYECFDAATPLSFDQRQELQSEDWKQIREKEVRSKIRCWLVSSSIQGQKCSKQEILDWEEFVISGEL